MAKRPNILFIMADQLAPQVLPAYGHPSVRTPHLDRLAEGGVVFENAYCNFPLCAPARFSMLSGRLPSRIGAFDNAVEFPASVPTFHHYLRRAGYRTCLAGKMHFVGPDQLHGYEERVTTDVHPADFLWTPDWRLDDETWLEWYHDMSRVLDVGPHQRSVNVAYDDEAEFEAVRWLHEHADSGDDRPFALTVSFISPHDPYLAPPRWWEGYDDVEIDMPRVADIALEARDPHSRRHWFLTGRHRAAVEESDVLRMRRAYYALTSYIDAKVGRLLETLGEIGAADDTLVVFTSDHGDSLGERGLFFKMSFFEWSVRVPLIVHAPFAFAPRRVRENVSHLDLFPTLLEAAGDGAQPELAAPIDGRVARTPRIGRFGKCGGLAGSRLRGVHRRGRAGAPADGPQGSVQADREPRRSVHAFQPRQRPGRARRPRRASGVRRSARGAGSGRRRDLGCRGPRSGGTREPVGPPSRERRARHRYSHSLGLSTDARRLAALLPRERRHPGVVLGHGALSCRGSGVEVTVGTRHCRLRAGHCFRGMATDGPRS